MTDVRFPQRPRAFAPTYEIKDEWYAQKNLADDLHVIIAHDTTGMTGPMYQRPNFPQTWARMHGKGRVFYTSMGHREEVWADPLYQALLLGALGWATGKVDINIEPNVSKATPGYAEFPKQPEVPRENSRDRRASPEAGLEPAFRRTRREPIG